MSTSVFFSTATDEKHHGFGESRWQETFQQNSKRSNGVHLGKITYIRKKIVFRLEKRGNVVRNKMICGISETFQSTRIARKNLYKVEDFLQFIFFNSKEYKRLHRNSNILCVIQKIFWKHSTLRLVQKIRKKMIHVFFQRLCLLKNGNFTEVMTEDSFHIQKHTDVLFSKF